MASQDASDQCSVQSKSIVVDLVPDANSYDRINYDPSASVFLNIGEVVCVAATAIIIITLLCILLYFEFKEHDSGMKK